MGPLILYQDLDEGFDKHQTYDEAIPSRDKNSDVLRGWRSEHRL